MEGLDRALSVDSGMVYVGYRVLERGAGAVVSSVLADVWGVDLSSAPGAAST